MPHKRKQEKKKNKLTESIKKYFAFITQSVVGEMAANIPIRSTLATYTQTT